MARVIKKYANRKLYDTKAKKYLTLHDVARLVEQGERVQVIDNQSRQDITSVILSSIIHESTKKEEHGLPEPMLVELIQKRGEAMIETVKKSMAVGMEAAELVQQEVGKRVKEVIEKGREQADGVAAVAESVEFLAKDLMTRLQKTIDETMEKNLAKVLDSMNIPTQQEIAKLEASVNHLSQQVSRLARKTAASPKRSRKVKAATKRPGRTKKKK